MLLAKQSADALESSDKAPPKARNCAPKYSPSLSRSIWISVSAPPLNVLTPANAIGAWRKLGKPGAVRTLELLVGDSSWRTSISWIAKSRTRAWPRQADHHVQA